MKQIIYFLIFLSICLSDIIFSQNPAWMVYNTSNSEIPSNTINCIAMDSDNNKWIGTNEGLVKFDGITWEICDTTNSELPSNWIFCIAIDKSDNKWIGTSEGLVKFDGITWIVYNSTNSGLPSNQIEKIVIDNYGNKWLGKVSDGIWQLFGLVKFDDNTWTVYDTTNSGLPSNGVWSLAIDTDDNKWIGTGNYGWDSPCCGAGLVKFNDTTWTLYNNENSGLTDNTIVDIAIDNNGNKWLLVEDGLIKFDNTKWTKYGNIESDFHDVSCLTIDLLNDMWVGLYGNSYQAKRGLSKFNGIEWTSYYLQSPERASNHVKCISVDIYGNKWIGTTDWQPLGFSEGGLTIFNEGGIIADIENVEANGKTKLNEYKLLQNYPNPFNPSTTIKYSIPQSVMLNSVQHLNNKEIPKQAIPAGRQVRDDNTNVSLKIYDILGREVTTLVNQKQNPGNYEVPWDGLSASGGQVPSGVYFYKLTVDASNSSTTGFSQTKKMILLR